MIKKATYFIVAVLLFSGLFWLLSQPPKDKSSTSSEQSEIASEKDTYKDSPVYDDPDLVFYWGNGCPHCENVEKWLDENNSDPKLKINYKEVYYNQNNQRELTETVRQNCPELMENGDVGIPLGFDPVNQKCIQGDTPIIDFLSAKLVE